MPELPADLLGDLEALAGGLLDAMDLPGLLGGIPALADLTEAIRPALESVRTSVAAVPSALSGLAEALGVS